jgi:hypothetical protein
MKRTIASVVTAVAATGSISLATVPAYAKPAPKPPTATLRIMPQWTYLDGGEFAVTTKCSARKDLRVIFSPLLHRPVVVPGAPSLPRHFKPDLTVQTGVRQVIVRTPAHHLARLSRHTPKRR